NIAVEEFFAARCGITYEQLLARARIGFPTVNVQAEFIAPLVYGDEVEAELFVSRIGRTSATFEYVLRRMSDRVLCARATLVHVAMNLDTCRAVEIPAPYRQAFAASAR